MARRYRSVLPRGCSTGHAKRTILIYGVPDQAHVEKLLAELPATAELAFVPRDDHNPLRIGKEVYRVIGWAECMTKSQKTMLSRRKVELHLADDTIKTVAGPIEVFIEAVKRCLPK